MKKFGWAAALIGGYLVIASAAMAADGQALPPDQAAFRALYKELVETNTTLSAGSCTLAAKRMAARLKAGGFKDQELVLFSTADHPKEGGLVAKLPGRDPKAPAMLLLAHLDVVEAKRADWTRDPVTLIEEGGFFYARGSLDDKAQAAIFTDIMIRFRAEGYVPQRTIKLALTCGEESREAFVGAKYLAQERPDLIAAAFALNEGGGGRADSDGKVVLQTFQVGEKAVKNFRIETTNVGGHSSVPIADNAIYQLADALAKIRAFDFPYELNDTTRTFFERVGASRQDDMGRAMVRLANDPADAEAAAILSKDRTYHSMLRTTCVATLLDGGHASNALPQRAGANINCRMFPGRTVEETRTALIKAIDDPGVTVTALPPERPVAVPPPLDPKIFKPAEELVARYFPGVPLIPSMSTGATDAIFMGLVGMPVYGIPGIWSEPNSSGVHGLNERVAVNALYTGRDFMTDLVKIYAENP
jgi:acetylornithine deacetylase/succinyl-diaminopimelate desuccinylase-like protein